MKDNMKFYDLNDYILINVIKYLSYVDRVKFERVDTFFRDLVADVFSQQQIFVTTFVGFFDNDKCACDKHRFQQCDIFVDKETDYWCKSRSSYKILLRCKN